MKLCLIFFSLVSVLFQDVSLKSSDEFELILDFQFKPRPQSETVNFTSSRSNSPLPFLAIELNVLKVLPDESKLRVLDFNNKVIATKSLSKGTSLKFTLGYTDDLKDQVSSHQYFINFIGPDKKLKRNIVILFEKDGSYFVNGEKRGKI